MSRKYSDGVSKMGINLERVRKIHQELMDSVDHIMNFAHPQCLFAFTSLFLSPLGKLFFATEAAKRCMYRHSISMACMAFWMIVVVFTFCFYSQKFKDQVLISKLFAFFEDRILQVEVQFIINEILFSKDISYK